MKHSQGNTQGQAALLRGDTSVDTPVKNSLYCVAAGITALPSSTAEVLTPHEKLREAATPDAALIAQDRPPAQPVEGYKHPQMPVSWLDPISGRACKTYSGRYCEPLYRHPVELIQPSPYAEGEATHKHIAALEQDKARLWDDVQALQIDSDTLNEQLLEALDERDTLRTQLAEMSAGAEHHALIEYALAPEAEQGALRVAAFLMGYYGSDNIYDPRDPAATITTRDRLALVTVLIEGTPHVIVDIGMRMLTPRELYRAQGFPDNNVIDHGHDGVNFSKKDQVLMVGSSVSPWPMMALVKANSDLDRQTLVEVAA